MLYLIILLFLAALAALALLVIRQLYGKKIIRWLRIKHYQYEVTFSLYMMTPTEKFILNSLLFLTLSMIMIALLLYLPAHLLKISKRAIYYWTGSSPLRAQVSSSSTAGATASAAAASVRP